MFAMMRHVTAEHNTVAQGDTLDPDARIARFDL
jgi:hypothetical protein